MSNQKTKSKKNNRNKTVEPNIFGLFFIKDSNGSKSYIEKCVDSHLDIFSEEKSIFLKSFIVDIYDLFISEKKERKKVRRRKRLYS